MPTFALGFIHTDWMDCDGSLWSTRIRSVPPESFWSPRSPGLTLANSSSVIVRWTLDYPDPFVTGWAAGGGVSSRDRERERHAISIHPRKCAESSPHHCLYDRLASCPISVRRRMSSPHRPLLFPAGIVLEQWSCAIVVQGARRPSSLCDGPLHRSIGEGSRPPRRPPPPLYSTDKYPSPFLSSRLCLLLPLARSNLEAFFILSLPRSFDSLFSGNKVALQLIYVPSSLLPIAGVLYVDLTYQSFVGLCRWKRRHDVRDLSFERGSFLQEGESREVSFFFFFFFFFCV